MNLRDRPLLTIEVSGVPRAGKSVIIARLGNLLRRAGIPTEDVDTSSVELPDRSPGDLEIALASLRARGLRVRFVETTTTEPTATLSAPVIDCRPRCPGDPAACDHLACRRRGCQARALSRVVNPDLLSPQISV